MVDAFDSVLDSLLNRGEGGGWGEGAKFENEGTVRQANCELYE